MIHSPELEQILTEVFELIRAQVGALAVAVGLVGQGQQVAARPLFRLGRRYLQPFSPGSDRFDCAAQALG